MRSASAATLKIYKLDEFHTEAMMHPLQISTFVIVGKATGHRGGKR